MRSVPSMRHVYTNCKNIHIACWLGRSPVAFRFMTQIIYITLLCQGASLDEVMMS